METKPAVIGTEKTLVELLQRLKPALAQLKPDEQSVERFLQTVRRVAQRNPDVLQCTVASMENAVKDSAVLGLDPTGLMGMGYIIPFRNKRGDMEATFIPGYHGLVDMIYRTKKVAGLNFKLVHRDDGWDYVEGSDPRIDHAPRFTGTIEYANRDECIGGYVTWWDVIDGKPVAKRQCWMWLAEIERVRCSSKQTRNGESSGTWRDEWQAMALKTLIRRAIKTMALTPDVADKLDYALSNEDAKMGKPDAYIDVTPGEPTAPAEGREKIGATE